MEGLLDRPSALHRSVGIIEGGHDAVAGMLDLPAPPVLERTADHCIMSTDHLYGSGISQPRCHAGRVHDVGEHDGPQSRIETDTRFWISGRWIRHPPQKGFDC